MVDGTSYGDWLIQQGIAAPISTPKENDVEKPKLIPSMSSSKDVDKDMELSMSDGIHKIEQHNLGKESGFGARLSWK